ncbi:hypothetical protein GCM10025883_06940 [Mobilicoccus caccae]|uniref:Uncharacterized protein n=1 Tax=Mobilicoccus caccae TaxID=1859295 RepID=A0ABQ6IL64_9MICO|nr:hypothetical protein GCM10025883_06940 [Mobilicoccus caccae]
MHEPAPLDDALEHDDDAQVAGLGQRCLGRLAQHVLVQQIGHALDPVVAAQRVAHPRQLGEGDVATQRLHGGDDLGGCGVAGDERRGAHVLGQRHRLLRSTAPGDDDGQSARGRLDEGDAEGLVRRQVDQDVVGGEERADERGVDHAGERHPVGEPQLADALLELRAQGSVADEREVPGPLGVALDGEGEALDQPLDPLALDEAAHVEPAVGATHRCGPQGDVVEPDWVGHGPDDLGLLPTEPAQYARGLVADGDDGLRTRDGGAVVGGGVEVLEHGPHVGGVLGDDEPGRARQQRRDGGAGGGSHMRVDVRRLTDVVQRVLQQRLPLDVDGLVPRRHRIHRGVHPHDPRLGTLLDLRPGGPRLTLDRGGVDVDDRDRVPVVPGQGRDGVAHETAPHRVVLRGVPGRDDDEFVVPLVGVGRGVEGADVRQRVLLRRGRWVLRQPNRALRQPFAGTRTSRPPRRNRRL